MNDRRTHWQNVYTEKDENTLSWYQPNPEISVRLIDHAKLGYDASILDVGGGSSHLVDALLECGYADLTVLDIADATLAKAQSRLGARAKSVQWLVSDITDWKPDRYYDLWHDRAVFHFLTDSGDRARYVAALDSSVQSRGQVIIGAFALDGPEQCSGLPVRRYDADALAQELGPAFNLLETLREDHVTPTGKVQHFQFCRFEKSA